MANKNNTTNETDMEAYKNIRYLLNLATTLKVVFFIAAFATIPLTLVLLFTSKTEEYYDLNLHQIVGGNYNYGYLYNFGLIPVFILAALYFDYTLKNKAYILLTNIRIMNK